MTQTFLPTIAFVDELIRCGLKELCFAPGSRSTPLALLFAERPEIRLIRHIDERSAGFFALGMAKASGRPVGLLCTSGTAAANFLPAVVEAYWARVPLVVLTADRPPEARDSGSPQTIDQVKIYGDHVKWYAEMPVPEARTELVDHARAFARRALRTALEPPAGPVHLNFPFREPLLPPERPFDTLKGLLLDEQPARAFHERSGPWEERVEPVVPSSRPSSPGSSTGPLRLLAGRLVTLRRGLIVCGPQDDPALGEALIRLAARLGYPVLADPLSQVRCGTHSKELVIDAYDAFLRDERFAGQIVPEVVLQFGAPPTSKALTQYLDRHRCPRYLIDRAVGRDPSHRAEFLAADPAAACVELEAAVAEREQAPGAGARRREPLEGFEGGERSGWAAFWRAVNQAARAACTEAAMSEESAPAAPLFEGRVFCELAALLPAGATLYAGNSMPVRDLDTFFPALERPIRFLANRGANGIDGVVSSALGASAACGGPLVLVIGDLSFLHDLTGLYAAKAHGLSATIVLIHNDGGGIFSFLPQASRPEHFEELFGTPTGLEFGPAVEMFGASFAKARDWGHFRSLVKEGLGSAGVHVIEVRSERGQNAARHRWVWQAVAAAIDPLLAEAKGKVRA